jgi:hypothetical protein
VHVLIITLLYLQYLLPVRNDVKKFLEAMLYEINTVRKVIAVQKNCVVR